MYHPKAFYSISSAALSIFPAWFFVATVEPEPALYVMR